jgi:hypothetical protein
MTMREPTRREPTMREPTTTGLLPKSGVTAGAAFVAHLYRRWWFIAAQAVVAVVVLVVVLALTGRTTYDFTAQFVLHPDPNSTTADVANRLDVLRQDGALVQTVLKVLGNNETLLHAGTAAGIRDTSQYSISATVSPGSSFFDVGVSGPSRRVTDALGKSVETVASRYVETRYHGFKFEVLGSEQAKHEPFPPSPTLVLLVFLLGAVVAAAELFVTFGFARLRSMVARVVDESADRESTPEQILPAVDDPVGADPSAPRPNGAGSNVTRSKKVPSKPLPGRPRPSSAGP